MAVSIRVILTILFAAQLVLAEQQDVEVRDSAPIHLQGWYNSVECGPWEEYQSRYECEDYSSLCLHDIYGFDCLTKMLYRDYERMCDVYSEPGHVYVKTTIQYMTKGAVVGCCNICTMSIDHRHAALTQQDKPSEVWFRLTGIGRIQACKP
jgi:hypothetical protein